MHPILRSRAVYDASIAVALEARFDLVVRHRALQLAGRHYITIDLAPELRVLRRIVRDAATLRRMRAERGA